MSVSPSECAWVALATQDSFLALRRTSGKLETAEGGLTKRRIQRQLRLQ